MSATATEVKLLVQSSTTNNHNFLKYRFVLILLSEIVLIAASYYLSFLLRLDAELDLTQHDLFWKTLPLVVVVKLIVFYRHGLLRGWWRYVGMSDIAKIGMASLVSSTVIFLMLMVGIRFQGFPRSVIPIDMLLCTMLVGGSRFMVRAYTERAHKYKWQKRTLVVGAGNAGAAIVRELKVNSALEYFPIGFIDDEPDKLGLQINGVKVLGNSDALPNLITKYAVECVLIAIPSAKGSQIERIVDKCRQCKVSFNILPPISELLSRPASVTQARKLRIEDLLSRQVVRPDLDRIRTRIENRVLLVTGAGGSIGSELARQVGSFNPKN